MIRPTLLAVIYIALSFCSFPGVNAGWLAWISLVPLFLLLNRCSSLKSFFVAAFLSEWGKWILLTIWLRHVSWFAVIGIAAAFAIYHSLWFLVLRTVAGRKLCEGIGKLTLLKLIGLGALWATMEMFRTQPFGLTGAHFCITQWKSPLMLQFASWIGGYGLSGLIVCANLLVTQLIWRLVDKQARKTNEWRVSVALILLGIFVLSILGFARLDSVERNPEENNKPVRIAIVQPNMPAYLNWTFERMSRSISTVLTESATLAKSNDFDFMVWPEGTLPGSIYPGSAMELEVRNLVDHYLNKPLLFGNQFQKEGRLYNAVLLCEPGTGINDSYYAKRILVPFGEYIPGRKYLKGIETIVPIPEDFSRGNNSGPLTMNFGNRKLNISSLVCYEDCFPGLLLNDDLSLVDLIYVATYNVWYGEEFGAYFHAAHSVMRAVEVGRPILRCGSAGWSGLIDAFGNIEQVVKSPETGSIYFQGSEVVEWVPGNRVSTVYKKYHTGIHFLYGLMALALLISLGRSGEVDDHS